jgi:uncharacterized RDD family membrane protein YckC
VFVRSRGGLSDLARSMREQKQCPASASMGKRPAWLFRRIRLRVRHRSPSLAAAGSYATGVGVRRNRQSLPGGVVLAPLWRRAVAQVIDLSVGAAFVGAVIAVGFAVLKAPIRIPRWLREKAKGWKPISWRTQMLVAVPLGASALQTRNRRSIGSRVMGLRHVQLQTGGPISVRSAVIQSLASRALREMRRVLVQPMVVKGGKRVRDLKPQVLDLQRQHAGDKAALEQAMVKLYREQGFNPLTPMAWSILPIFASEIIPVLVTPRRQTIPDLAAGVVVVTDSRTGDDQDADL